MSVTESIATRLRPVADHEVALLLRWRNHPDVRATMFTDHEISVAEHQAWWENAQADASRETRIFELDGAPTGVVNFFRIDASARRCHWGFYLDNAALQSPAVRLRAWLALEQAAIDYAFGELGCVQLSCETFAFNAAVLDVHRRFGFRETEVFHHERNGRVEKVIRTVLENPKAGTAPSPDPGAALVFAFLGSANWDLAGAELEQQLTETERLHAVVQQVPFGSYRIQLTDGESALRRADPAFLIFCERFEDLLPAPFAIADHACREALEARLDEYLSLLRAARATLSGVFLVADLAPVRPVSELLLDADDDPDALRGCVREMNARLRALCAELPDTYLLSLSAEVGAIGTRQADPGKYWHLGRIAYSQAMTHAFCRRVLKTVLALRGASVRVIVTDLDNTLWGGVIGDDGLEGLALGGEHPGSAFVEVQHTLRAFRNRGVALAVCSKNTEEIALEALTRHPGMVLKPEDFIARRINWDDKPGNITALADEIGVGLASILFIDDNPVERDAVRRALPDVIVPEMPTDVTAWPALLLDHPFLAGLSLTNEDATRVARYQVRASVARERDRFASRDGFLRSLAMRLSLQRPDHLTTQRMLQLLAKTNQFNMTTRRHTERDVRMLCERGARCVLVGLADKYSAREIIGVLIAVPSDGSWDRAFIDTFLLSCRVLGRGVETGVLAWLCEDLAARGCRLLEGHVVPTPRNAPAQSVYPDHGFTPAADDRFLLRLPEQAVRMPDWFRVDEELAA